MILLASLTLLLTSCGHSDSSSHDHDHGHGPAHSRGHARDPDASLNPDHAAQTDAVSPAQTASNRALAHRSPPLTIPPPCLPSPSPKAEVSQNDRDPQKQRSSRQQQQRHISTSFFLPLEPR